MSSSGKITLVRGKHAKDTEPYVKRSEDDSVTRSHSPVAGSHEAGHGSESESAMEEDGVTDFSEEHMKEVSACWALFFNLCEHGPMRRTDKAKLQALRDAGQTKAFINAAKANERNNRIGNAVRELLKMAKEQGSVTALAKSKALLKEAEENVKRLCAESKESYIPRKAARTGSSFNKDNLDVKSLFQ